ncbi:MAG: hypothetical protein V1735_08060 [Nanoarchaeota archaeon]
MVGEQVMVEFNADGSIKLPEAFARRKADDEVRLKTQRCLRIRREIVSFRPPKECVLSITAADAILDRRFVETVWEGFNRTAKTPMKLSRLGDKEFEIRVGSDFHRCSECAALRGRFREFLDGNIIDVRGNCAFEQRKFDYEDYFD